MAFLTMAAAFLTGKELQGCLYWAMNVIGLRDYTVLIFRILCIGVVAVTAGGIILIVRGMKSGKISLENKEVPKHSLIGKLLFQLSSVVPLAVILLIGLKYRGTVLWGC